MSIRTRLFLAFGILALFVIAISAIFVFYSIQTKTLLDRSITTQEVLTLWKEIYISLERQVRSINYFLILNDPAEIEKFNEQNEIIQTRLIRIPESESKKKFSDPYSKFVNVTNRMFKTKRENIFSFHDSFLLPVEKEVEKTIADIIEENNKLMNRYESTIKNFSRKGLFISLIFGVSAVLISTFFAVVTFLSIWGPLKSLIKGTQIIGEGNLEYKIDIKSGVELQQLASSFNKMVDNLKNLQLQIVQMDRMSSIGQLAGGVAHEINNPLTGVLGQAQILLEKIPKDRPEYQHLQRIEQAAQRCRKIVRALLDFAREKNYVFNKVKLDELINDALRFCETEMHSANIEVIKNFSEEPHFVNVSPSHIQQVFLNIINNAIYAMPKGGKLFITTKVENGMVHISFRDTGVGIKKEHLNHVFDPFFTTKDVGKGTGLGLTVSYGIIQKHNGKITAFSEGENKGAEFVVSLPLAD